MRNVKSRVLAIFSILTLSLAITAGCGSSETKTSADAPKPAPAATTIDNLQAAYNGEMNAKSKYTAFALKAYSEGYDQVSQLFRAAAEAEYIHANNHAEAIKKMGATPTAKVKPAPVLDTASNLKNAIEGESYERDQMYPKFVEQARVENLPVAERTFNMALGAEAEHAKLFADALNNMDNYKKGTRVFYVCPVCGFTTMDAKLAKCPTCGTPKESFIRK